MEEEVRRILNEAVSAPDRLGDLALKMFGPNRGVDLELPKRRPARAGGFVRMILIDTNVISEVMKVSPSLQVLEWLNRQDTNVLYVSAITIGEIEYGLRILPNGRRRLELKERFERFISEAFMHRILAFDESAARTYGDVMGLRKELGRPMSVPDGQDCSNCPVRWSIHRHPQYERLQRVRRGFDQPVFTLKRLTPKDSPVFHVYMLTTQSPVGEKRSRGKVYAKGFLDALHVMCGDSRCFCVTTPILHRTCNLPEECYGFGFLQASCLRKGGQILDLKVIAFSVQAHLVPAGPGAIWIVGIGYVERG